MEVSRTCLLSTDSTVFPDFAMTFLLISINFYKINNDFKIHHNLNENCRHPLFFSSESINWNVRPQVPLGAKLGIKFLQVNSMVSPESQLDVNSIIYLSKNTPFNFTRIYALLNLIFLFAVPVQSNLMYYHINIVINVPFRGLIKCDTLNFPIGAILASCERPWNPFKIRLALIDYLDQIISYVESRCESSKDKKDSENLDHFIC